MVFLTSCWFIIETVIIPGGYVKWTCLSYFIYPVFLVFVHMFLLVQKLIRCAIVTVTCLLGVCGSACGYVVRPLILIKVYVQKLLKGGHDEEDQYFDIIDADDSLDTISADSSNNPSLVLEGLHEVPIAEVAAEEMNLFEENFNEVPVEETSLFEDSDGVAERTELHSERNVEQEYVSYPNVETDLESSDSGLDPIEYPSLDFFDSPIQEYSFMRNSNGYFASNFDQNFPASETESEQAEPPNPNTSTDPLYVEYTEIMSWFDMLNHDRNSAMDSIKKSLNTGYPFEASLSFVPSYNTSKKDLIRSLEFQFEMIYVAQLCLSWEALHHQYRMVEDYLANSSTQHGFFYTNVAGEFQKFHIHLNRFMEDEWTGGKRYMNYVERRFVDKSFLQIPELSGFYEEAKHGTMGEAMNDARQVLKAIEECVKTYYEFVKMDRKYSWWQIKSKLWTYPPVVDPQDFDLLEKLTRMLQMKEFFVKDITGKKRCWLNKRVTTVHVGDFEAQKDMLFSMINLKLVKRVLDLYIVTTPQLKWCKEKLDSITFMGGSVATISCIRPMFPA